MKRNLLLVLFVTLKCCITYIVCLDDRKGYDMIHASVADIIQSRGYLAEDHFVTTTDGYILNLVRARNPLVKNKVHRNPILCIHGWTFSAKAFVVNSVNARPKDYSHIDASKMSLKELDHLFRRDPAKNSLVFTALNFGHEVWLMNRRGSTPSLGHSDNNIQAYISPLNNLGGLYSKQSVVASKIPETNQTDFLLFIKNEQSKFTHLNGIINPKYWDFSFDEQAKYDLPETIDYILDVTEYEHVSIVGHSAGAALALMMLSTKTEYAKKVSKSLLWAPALYLPTEGDSQFVKFNEEATKDYVGPIPQPILIPAMREMLALSCDGLKRGQKPKNCSQAINALYGYSGNQQKARPGFVASFVESVGSHETASIVQAAKKGKMHHFDYGHPDKNIEVYGNPEAPIYDVSKITASCLTFWNGNSDSATTIVSVKQIAQDMRVPVAEYYLNDTGVLFDHVSFFIHRKAASLINLPGIKVLQEY